VDACGFLFLATLFTFGGEWGSFLLVLGWMIVTPSCHSTDPCSCWLGTCVFPLHTVLESVLRKAATYARALEIVARPSELTNCIGVIQHKWDRPSSLRNSDFMCTDLWII
jgi:hypothetical protein